MNLLQIYQGESLGLRLTSDSAFDRWTIELELFTTALDHRIRARFPHAPAPLLPIVFENGALKLQVPAAETAAMSCGTLHMQITMSLDGIVKKGTFQIAEMIPKRRSASNRAPVLDRHLHDNDLCFVLEMGPHVSRDGVGVPAGGTTGQVLTKITDVDFDTRWSGPVPGRKEVQRMARTTPQPVVREIMHEALLFRPKGHVFYVAPDVEWAQVAGLIPNRAQIKYEQPKEIIDTDHTFAVPVFDRRYVESLNYQLRWENTHVQDEHGLVGTIRLKLDTAAIDGDVFLTVRGYTEITARIGEDGALIPHAWNTPIRLPYAELVRNEGLVLVELVHGDTLHVRILLMAGGVETYADRYVRVGEDMRFEPLGTPATMRPPYVGRINARSLKTCAFPGESLYGQIVSPSRFVAGRLFSGDESPEEMLRRLGYLEAFENGYRLFVRMTRKRGARYIFCPEPLSRRFGMPGSQEDYRTFRRALKKRSCYGFRIAFIDCCIAKVRSFNDEPDRSDSMDMNFPRFYFSLRAVRYNFHASDGFADRWGWQAVQK